MTSTRPNTVALRLSDEVVAWADANATEAGVKRSVWLASFLQAQRDASPANGPELAEALEDALAVLVPGAGADPVVIPREPLVDGLEADEPDRHDGLLAGADEVVAVGLAADVEGELVEVEVTAGSAAGQQLATLPSPSLAVSVSKERTPCRHPELRKLGYGTFCADPLCGVRVR